ncbi:hypothetical protein [Pseudoclavibacter sp. 13-3]|uniref:hypothetical protein n=1 Tax=Pseudoclavibacter sp. 13-3 TaxID=2901228 RepID=UPI001E3D53C3|nr:hypothetical protein [Pseudoclavibacter sp. 13-3]MCD7101886.1 hypothetical protein [Pseudoclavibacter sp. 13-3]
MRQTRPPSPNQHECPPPRMNPTGDHTFTPVAAPKASPWVQMPPPVGPDVFRQSHDGPPPRIRIRERTTSTPTASAEQARPDGPPQIDEYFAPDQFFD